MSVGVLREGDIWSPYYKIEVINQGRHRQGGTQTRRTPWSPTACPTRRSSIDFRLEASRSTPSRPGGSPKSPVGDVLVVSGRSGRPALRRRRRDRPALKQARRGAPASRAVSPRVTPYIGGRAFLPTDKVRPDLRAARLAHARGRVNRHCGSEISLHPEALGT
jgi:hypothetical protein